MTIGRVRAFTVRFDSVEVARILSPPEVRAHGIAVFGSAVLIDILVTSANSVPKPHESKQMTPNVNVDGGMDFATNRPMLLRFH